jgi:hypothetical protein
LGLAVYTCGCLICEMLARVTSFHTHSFSFQVLSPLSDEFLHFSSFGNVVSVSVRIRATNVGVRPIHQGRRRCQPGSCNREATVNQKYNIRARLSPVGSFYVELDRILEF